MSDPAAPVAGRTPLPLDGPPPGSPSTGPGRGGPRLPWRASLAVQALRAANQLSRLLGRGSGTVAGGKLGLAVDPQLLATLARGRRVALVTGTNGKTTTTGMLVRALSAPGVAVASNTTGANMPPGHVSALAASPRATIAVLEVDEGYLRRLVDEARPAVVVLLNLSRDQLDRISEVRMLVERWRLALAGLPDGSVVVANADDPMVVRAAEVAGDVRWVGAGQVWRHDAVGCPACGGRIVFGPLPADGDGQAGWRCDSCAFSRPEPMAWLDDNELALADGTRLPVAIDLPGQFNRANAALVAVAAPAMVGGLSTAAALERLTAVGEVAGRFSTVRRGGRDVRLMLAKNPAGWTAIFDLLDEVGHWSSPVVLSVNAQVADGLDTSWLWDVPFERLAGRRVVATGERCRDLSVRLKYAGVPHTVVADPVAAADTAVAMATTAGVPDDQPVELLGNYTAFAFFRRRVSGRWAFRAGRGARGTGGRP